MADEESKINFILVQAAGVQRWHSRVIATATYQSLRDALSVSPSNGNICLDITEESSSEVSSHLAKVTQLPGILPNPACSSPKLELIPYSNSVSGPQRDKEGENCSHGGR